MTNLALTLIPSRKGISDVVCDTIGWRVFVMEKQNKDVNSKSKYTTESVYYLCKLIEDVHLDV